MRGHHAAGLLDFRLKTILGLVATVLGLLALATPASAAYQQLPGEEGIFAGVLGKPPAEFPEEVQLGGVGGMAVNRTGNGGVPAGTLYAAVGTLLGGSWVAMYEPADVAGEKRLKFVQAWQLRPGESYVRCGPLAIEAGKGTNCKALVEAQGRELDVDVDQATGNVYAIKGTITTTGNPMVAAYKPDGSEEIANFGKRAAGGKKTAETAAEIHESSFPGGIAMGSGGTVYVFDLNSSDNFYHRLMTFKPKSPGNFSDYEYVVGGDIAAGFLGQGNIPSMPVTDAAGHIYVAGAGGGNVEEYDPIPGSAPICEFEFAQGGIVSLTVDPVKEEPFFFSTKKVEGAKKIHHLSKCSGGKFSEVETIELEPERDDLYALAFDPVRQISPSRPAGVLYGGAPSPEPAVGKGEKGQSSLGYVFAALEEDKPPVIESESVSTVTGTSAQLQATINPENLKTRYTFEYLTQAQWEANEPTERFAGAAQAPPEGAVLGEGNKPLAAAETVTGLAPATTYHYRVLASNCPENESGEVEAEEACEAEGEDKTFKTLALAAPGNRAYELVSPPQKNGGQALPADSRLGLGSCGQPECKPGVSSTRFPMIATADGNEVAYEGTPFFPGQGAAVENQYLAPRNPVTGWATQNLTPNLLVSKRGGGYKAFTPSLATALLQQSDVGLTTQAPLQYPNYYLQQSASPLDLTTLLVSPPPNRQPGQGPEQFLLTYAGASTDLSKVFFEANDALTEATATAPKAEGGPEGKVNLYEWSATGPIRLVNVAPANAASFPGAEFGDDEIVSHAISEKGDVAYFSDEAGQLYARIDAAETVEVDDAGKFLTASADGQEILLTDGCLYDLAEEECTDLTEDEAETHQGGFQGIAGQSEDLSHVYFVDTAVLTNVPNEAGEEAQPAKPNLYAFEATQTGGETSFVATLAAQDDTSWSASPSLRNAEASPQGRWLVFQSEVKLTGQNNLGPCSAIPGSIIPCPQAFLFDSQTGHLYCASCNQSQAPPLGYTVLRLIEGASSAMPQARYLTDTGRLFFDSRDSLVAADTNGGAEDVYEFAPTGVAGCSREAGCQQLVSSGREDTDSNLVTVDPTAANVFFTTRERLVPADTDELIDLYDAREGGGIANEATPRPLPCQGEVCQPPPPPAPEPPLGTQIPSEGNVKSKCKKGQVRKHGKCVKKKRVRIRAVRGTRAPHGSAD
jgi:hypothetical protein